VVFVRENEGTRSILWVKSLFSKLNKYFYFSYNVNLSGIPEVIQQKIVPLNAIPDLPPLIVQQPPKIELPDFSRPPPMFDPSRPPPVSIMPSNSIPPFNSITTVSASLNEPPPIPQFNIAPPIFRV
jgi:hypothetical protein